jgi:hypothetical protein
VNKTGSFSIDPFAGFREQPLAMQIGSVRDALQRAIEAAIREANRYARAGQKAAAAMTN